MQIRPISCPLASVDTWQSHFIEQPVAWPWPCRSKSEVPICAMILSPCRLVEQEWNYFTVCTEYLSPRYPRYRSITRPWRHGKGTHVCHGHRLMQPPCPPRQVEKLGWPLLLTFHFELQHAIARAVCFCRQTWFVLRDFHYDWSGLEPHQAWCAPYPHRVQNRVRPETEEVQNTYSIKGIRKQI